MAKPRKTWREKLLDDKDLPKSGGELNPKYPGSVEALKVRLEAEGHRVLAKGKKWIIADYERCLVSGDSNGRAKFSGRASSTAKPAKSAGRGR